MGCNFVLVSDIMRLGNTTFSAPTVEVWVALGYWSLGILVLGNKHLLASEQRYFGQHAGLGSDKGRLGNILAMVSEQLDPGLHSSSGSKTLHGWVAGTRWS